MPALPSLHDLLACPVDGTALSWKGGHWISAAGRKYRTIQGIPVLFHRDASDTLAAMTQSRLAVQSNESASDDPWYVNTLGLDEDQKEPLLKALQRANNRVDPVVAHMVAHTCGNLYGGLVGNLPRYPIPHFRLTNGAGRILVDLGCNWGRWCIAASRQGFLPIGIDPQIGALLAAQRVTQQLGVKAHFICADARHLPLRAGVADVAFSYSVVQHFCRADAAQVIREAGRITKPGGRLLVQMPNIMGMRCLYQWARRGFSDGVGFNVRYWSLPQLRRAFGAVGQVDFAVDCFFGIGLQPSDADLMPAKWRALLAASERLRRLTRTIPALAAVADSVYVNAIKNA